MATALHTFYDIFDTIIENQDERMQLKKSSFQSFSAITRRAAKEWKQTVSECGFWIPYTKR